MKTCDASQHYNLIEKAIALLDQANQELLQGSRDHDMSLSELGQILDHNPQYLQKIFSEWAGLSPKQFIHYLKREHAFSMLRSGATALQTTLELGLKSSSQLHNLTVKLEAMSPAEIRQGGANVHMAFGQATTPLGQVFVCQSNKGIHSLEFAHAGLEFDGWAQGLQDSLPNAKWNIDHAQADSLASRIFNGRQTKGDDQEIKLQLKASPFQLQVWQALVHLPSAHVLSYQDLARSIGRPSATRAVASAVAKNPIAYLIPCHRVIQSTGKLGQFRWSAQRKQALYLWEQGNAGISAA